MRYFWVKPISRFILPVVLLLSWHRIGLAAPAAEVIVRPWSVQVGSLRVAAELGSFSVPERHANPGGRRIKLAFVRFKSTAGHATAPILYLAGGPGTSGVDYATSQRFEPYLSLRHFGDVIVLNQRGTPHSEPDLTCPAPFQFPLAREATRELLTAAYQRFAVSCAEYWRDRNVDLSAYNTKENAHDVKALADALGIWKMILFGASYGSHLGLAVIRYHPEIVQRAVLGGIEGPDQTIKLPADVTRQLDMISRLMASDPRVRKVFSDFHSAVSELMDRLSKHPVDVPVAATRGSEAKPILRLSAVDVQILVASLLGSREDIASLPRLFGPALHGDYSRIAAIVARQFRTAPVSAMNAAMDCASSASADRLKTIDKQRSTALLGSMMDFPLPEWCTGWNVTEAPDAFRAPLRSSVPTLFIAGSLDGQTPIKNAREVRKGFSHGTLFTVMNAGHDSSLFRSSAELIRSIDRFFAAGEAYDAVFEAAPLEFELPSE